MWRSTRGLSLQVSRIHQLRLTNLGSRSFSATTRRTRSKLGGGAALSAVALAGCFAWWQHATSAANRPEEHLSASTYYRATLPEEPTPRPALAAGEQVQVDVCVVGGGLAGLATALGVGERGGSSIVLEANRLGWGGSGMNGGMAIAGFMLETDELIDEIGAEAATTLVRQSLEAQRLLRQRIRSYGIECDTDDSGYLCVTCFPSDEGARELQHEVQHVNQLLGTELSFVPTSRVRDMLKTDFVSYGVLDPSSFWLNPLKLVLGLARAVERNGGRICEATRAVLVEPVKQGAARWRVTTADGAEVLASHVVYAGGPHLERRVSWRVASATVPILTYIMVTEPLGERLRQAIDTPYMVCDDRFALSYYRVLPDGRLFWGGLGQTLPVPLDKLEHTMRAELAQVYPQLADVKVDYLWGGTIGCGLDWMPLIGQLRPGEWYAAGFGGHGIVPTTLAGELIASAICSNDTRYRQYQELFPLQFAGGVVGSLVAEALVLWYQTWDRIGIWRAQRQANNKQQQ